ncbi:hypothetical protein K1719_004335 [Acacia pycnantha]|nr:hypothetical protein K1719_004335 [Acacia pycnantha]
MFLPGNFPAKGSDKMEEEVDAWPQLLATNMKNRGGRCAGKKKPSFEFYDACGLDKGVQEALPCNKRKKVNTKKDEETQYAHPIEPAQTQFAFSPSTSQPLSFTSLLMANEESDFPSLEAIYLNASNSQGN